MKGPTVSREDACQKIRDFLGEGEPILVGLVNNFDTTYLVKLFGGVDRYPFYWLHLDFASMLYKDGIDPILYTSQDKLFFESLNIDLSEYNIHNALDDARLLKRVWGAVQQFDI